jgi:hypothetical protein
MSPTYPPRKSAVGTTDEVANPEKRRHDEDYAKHAH